MTLTVLGTTLGTTHGTAPRHRCHARHQARRPSPARTTARLIAAAALAVAILGAPAQALAGPLRAPVLTALAGIEDVPTAADLSSLGEGVREELIELTADTSLTHSQRARATHALGYFPSADSLATLQALLAGDDDLLARKASFALATGWADESVPWLSGALSADSTQLRMASTRALGGLRSEAARTALRTRLPAEANPAVASLLRAQLAD